MHKFFFCLLLWTLCPYGLSAQIDSINDIIYTNGVCKLLFHDDSTFVFSENCDVCRGVVSFGKYIKTKHTIFLFTDTALYNMTNKMELHVTENYRMTNDSNVSSFHISTLWNNNNENRSTTSIFFLLEVVYSIPNDEIIADSEISLFEKNEENEYYNIFSCRRDCQVIIPKNIKIKKFRIKIYPFDYQFYGLDFLQSLYYEVENPTNNNFDIYIPYDPFNLLGYEFFNAKMIELFYNEKLLKFDRLILLREDIYGKGRKAGNLEYKFWKRKGFDLGYPNTILNPYYNHNEDE